MQKSVIVLASLFLLGAAWAQDTPKPASPAAVETRTYKGTLVDASCAGSVTQKAPAAKADSNAADRDAAGKSGKTAGEQGCAVSGSTKEFALRTKDGRVLRFDDLGNQRTADAIKNKKNWSDAMAAGKAITARVGGASVDGDNLTVVTID